MKTIVIFSIKGGIAKTTTTTNTARGLVNKGKKVLVIDTDYQGNTTDEFLEESSDTLVDFLIGNRKTLPVYETKLGVDIVPSSLDLGIVVNNNNIMHTRLKVGIRKLEKEYDYILIDTNCNVSDLTFMSLVACDQLIVPIKLEKKAIKGWEYTLEQVEAVEENYEKEIDTKILFTMFNRLKKEKELIDEISSKHKCFNQVIRTQNKYAVETSYDSSKQIIDTKSNLANDYKNLVSEIINENK